MPKIVRRLTLIEVATLLGWPTDGPPIAARKRTRDRLRAIEARTGVSLIRRGGGRGNPSTVAWSSLRAAGLVDDVAATAERLREERDELARSVATLRRALSRLARRVMALEQGQPPARRPRRRTWRHHETAGTARASTPDPSVVALAAAAMSPTDLAG